MNECYGHCCFEQVLVPFCERTAFMVLHVIKINFGLGNTLLSISKIKFTDHKLLNCLGAKNGI